MHIYRAAIIVKKKKKRKGCARFPVEKRGWIYVEGWIDKSDGSTDGSWLYRSGARKRREESRREGKRIFREKWETDERGRIYRCVRAYIRDFQATTTTLIQLISPFSIQPPIPRIRSNTNPREVEDSSHFRPLKIKPSIGRGIYSQPPVQEFTLSQRYFTIPCFISKTISIHPGINSIRVSGIIRGT